MIFQFKIQFNWILNWKIIDIGTSADTFYNDIYNVCASEIEQLVCSLCSATWDVYTNHLVMKTGYATRLLVTRKKQHVTDATGQGLSFTHADIWEWQPSQWQIDTGLCKIERYLQKTLYKPMSADHSWIYT